MRTILLVGTRKPIKDPIHAVHIQGDDVQLLDQSEHIRIAPRCAQPGKEPKYIFLIHHQLLGKTVQKLVVVKLGGVLCQYLGEPHVCGGGVWDLFRVELTIEGVVPHRLYQRRQCFIA